ncbi:peptide-methionine (R)-S-oxide reductase MsrB [Cognatishimia sp. WU-CL00825]|uniref:peptide-methionine (R)-S-oxide reductase MsrB n=1 Tax=Cognatishimia sp. WU-CL00825 TaxID=3127658 RepID=UPI003103A277
MNRREILLATTAAALIGGRALGAGGFEVTRSDAEWRAMLTKLQYKVMREDGTERAFTSPLDKNWKDGSYHCRGCDLKVYSSRHKFDSGTGWPSFYKALPNAIRTKPDRIRLRVHTEAHCRRCGSHFGHIFNDGPKPTGKRHCLNGASLVFKAA